MTSGARPPDERRNDDGIRIVPIARPRRTWWWIGVALAVPVVATVLAVAIIRRSSDEPATAAPPLVARAEAGATASLAATSDAGAGRTRPVPVASGAPARVVPRRVAGTEPVGLGASPVPQPQKPRRDIDAASAIQALRDEGIHDGIAAFGLPGSNPPKSGILVPEEFELPEGYVRHYQSTDDGEQLPAILMFHPDYEFVDEHGNVMKLPADGIVPPEMAPPGIDVDQVLSVPERKAGEPVR